MVQNAKYYHITRQENLEFLGEFDGGAKIASNSGMPNFGIKTPIVDLLEKKKKRYSSILLINLHISFAFYCAVIGLNV